MDADTGGKGEGQIYALPEEGADVEADIDENDGVDVEAKNVRKIKSLCCLKNATTRDGIDGRKNCARRPRSAKLKIEVI